MSMSTQHGGGGTRRPTVESTGSGGKKPAPPATKSTPPKSGGSKPGGPKSGGSKPGGSKSTGSKPATRGGGPRRPIAPVKVNQGRNWGPIALFVAVALIAAAIVGYGGYYLYKNGQSWQDKAEAIAGMINWRTQDPEAVKQGLHQEGPVPYAIKPPVGGPHNNAWQRCFGDVYDAPIAAEHAVHSLEHGAVWITYQPDLPADQVEALAARVRGNEYLLMSPFEGLDKPISLQAWGYQLKVDNAADKRINEFIQALKQNASMEGPTATCTSGNYVTATGTAPRDMSQQQPPPGGGMTGGGG